MTKSVYTLNSILEFINGEQGRLIESIKVTSAEKVSFNSMEGIIYHVRLSVITKQGYQNKRLLMETNSTSVEDFEDWDNEKPLKENFQSFIGVCFGCLGY